MAEAQFLQDPGRGGGGGGAGRGPLSRKKKLRETEKKEKKNDQRGDTKKTQHPSQPVQPVDWLVLATQAFNQQQTDRETVVAEMRGPSLAHCRHSDPLHVVYNTNGRSWDIWALKGKWQQAGPTAALLGLQGLTELFNPLITETKETSSWDCTGRKTRRV